MKNVLEKNTHFVYSKIRCPSKDEKCVPAYREDLKVNLAKLGLRIEDLKGKKVLDAACGSGELTTYLASFGADVTAIDFSENSLESARILAEMEGVKVNFIHGSVIDYKFPKKYFDFAMSHMALQHVVKPKEAFANIASSVKPGGMIFIRIMQLWGSLWPNRKYNAWQYWLVKFLAGDNLEKRTRLADRLFFRKRAAAIEKYQGIKYENYIWDCFAAKISYHTYGELLKWFVENDIKYISSNPSIEFGKFLRMFLDKETKPKSFKGKFFYQFYSMFRLIAKIPILNTTNFLNRCLSQLATVVLKDTNMVSLLGKKSTKGLNESFTN